MSRDVHLVTRMGPARVSMITQIVTRSAESVFKWVILKNAARTGRSADTAGSLDIWRKIAGICGEIRTTVDAKGLRQGRQVTPLHEGAQAAGHLVEGHPPGRLGGRVGAGLILQGIKRTKGVAALVVVALLKSIER